MKPPSLRRPIYGNLPGSNIKMFLGYEGDPGTGTQNLGAIINRRPRPYVFKRRVSRGTGGPASNLGALGVADRHVTFPTSVGTPGNPFQGDYDEHTIWGTDGPTDTVTAPVDPLTAVPEVQGPEEMDPGISIPFGISIIAWRNPTTMQSVPINSSTNSILPVLSLNMQRNSLIIQNNSFVTVATDATPNFYVGFNAQPQIGLSLQLIAGAGILFDILTPRDSIYITVAGGGASQVIQGVVVQGTYAPV
jgi:hypothetical protein